MDLTNSGLEKTSAENWEKAHSQEWVQEERWEGQSLKKAFACKKTPQDHTKLTGIPGKKIRVGETEPELGVDGEIVDGLEKAEFRETRPCLFSLPRRVGERNVEKEWALLSESGSQWALKKHVGVLNEFRSLE